MSYGKSGPGNLDRFIPRKTRGPLGAVFCEKYSAASNSAGCSANSGVHRELHAASLFHNGGRGRRHGKRERHFHIFPRINIALRRTEAKSRTRRRPAAKSRARRHEILMRARLHQTGLRLSRDSFFLFHRRSVMESIVQNGQIRPHWTDRFHRSEWTQGHWLHAVAEIIFWILCLDTRDS